MITTLLNFRRHKPLPAGHIYIGRANRFGCTGVYGNVHTPGPCAHCSARYKIKVEHQPEEVLPLFMREFLVRLLEEKGLAKAFLTLKGRALVCGCVKEPWWPGREGDEKPCHGRPLAEFLEKLPPLIHVSPEHAEAVVRDAAKTELARLAAEAVEEADAR